MGIFTEYLDKNLDLQSLTQERRKQLKRISKLRGGRDVLVYAADLSLGISETSIGYSDLQRINDQLLNLNGTELDLILETPGGSGEVAEDIVKNIRGKFKNVAVIIPGWTRSAGTLIAMACDEILMDQNSSLGPIDAQLHWQGKVFSAGELLEGLDAIKDDIAQNNGILNPAYIPILQGISPGELMRAENAQDFSKHLVAEWLVKYKFKDWTEHRTTNPGTPVTDKQRQQKAEKIATELRDHKKWLTHGRSIRIDDLQTMGLEIEDYGKDDELSDAIRRYHALLHITFGTNVYKIFETPNSQIFDFLQQPPQNNQPAPDYVNVDLACNHCNERIKLQVNFKPNVPAQNGCLQYPKNDNLECPACKKTIDLKSMKNDIEANMGRRIVVP